MTPPLHWVSCRRCGQHVGYIVGREGERGHHHRALKRCAHVPSFVRFTPSIARRLVREGYCELTTQERLFA